MTGTIKSLYNIWTDDATGLTSTKATFQQRIKYKSNYLVTYKIVFTANSAISQDTDIIKGFDTERGGYNGFIWIVGGNHYTMSSPKFYYIVDNNGRSLRCTSSISKDESVRMTFTYVTEFLK